MKKTFFLLLLAFCTIAPAQTITNIQASGKKPRKAAAYKFEFTAESVIARDAEIGVVFPHNFILSKVVMADSRTMNGGLTVRVKGDTVLIKRSGLGNPIPAGKQVDVILASVVNAGDMNRKYDFQLFLYQNHQIIASQRTRKAVSLLAARQQ